MKHLTQRQRRAVANYNRKVRKNQSGFKKHSMKVNAASLRMWLSKHNIEPPVKLIGVLIQIVKAELYRHLHLKEDPAHVFFGVGLDENFNEQELVKRVERALARHSKQVLRKSRVSDLKKSYKRVFGKTAPTGASEAWLRNAIRVGPLSLLKFETGGFESRKRVKNLRRPVPSERTKGCALDEQAKALGIYDKEFTVSITRKEKDPETGLNKSVVVEEITKPYPELSRAQRKRQNHLAYKKAKAA